MKKLIIVFLLLCYSGCCLSKDERWIDPKHDRIDSSACIKYFDVNTGKRVK